MPPSRRQARRQPGDYMATLGGALRIFYQGRVTRGARPYSLQLRDELVPVLGAGLEPWYRVEASRYDHFDIPRLYGWRVLADAAADVPDAYVEPVRQSKRPTREAELVEPAYEESFEESPEPEWEPELWDEEQGLEEAEDDFELVGEAPPYAEAPADYEAEDLGWAEWVGEDGEYAASTLLEDSPAPPPPPASGGGGGGGKWVVLVAGFDYQRSGVAFDSIALNRMQRLIQRHVATEKRAKASAAHVIDTAPRFVLFDVKSGLVRTRTMGADGKWAWSPKPIATFRPVSAANYQPAGSHAFNTDQADRMSITDVYAHVESIGASEPGSLAELSFFSHGSINGPILVNSFEGLGFKSTADRDPDDKDGRGHKDFGSPTMDAAALASFRAAFDSSGFIWAWGCAFAKSPRQVLHRVLSSTKYRRTPLGKLVDTDTFTLSFSQEEADALFSADTNFFPQPVGGKVGLTFDRTLEQVTRFFRGQLGGSYCKRAAVGAHAPCFGALPGTYSDYERGTSLPLMLVPTKRPPYSDDFTRSIRFYTTYLGVSTDSEGRHYGRYDP